MAADLLDSVKMSDVEFNAEEIYLQPKYGFYMIISTICFFHMLNKLVAAANHTVTADNWFYRNLYCSFVHAFISGIWSLYCVLNYPELLKTMYDFKNFPAYALAAFSSGYFVYDFLDIAMNRRCRERWEVCLHHVAVCASMLYNVSYVTCIGYHVVVMSLEVNSVFLHGRKLLQLNHWRLTSLVYRVNSALNIITFIVFRLGALAIITLAVYLEKDRISRAYFLLMFATMFVIDVMNIILLQRLMFNDFIRKDYRRKEVENSCEILKVNNNYDVCIDEKIKSS